MKLLRRAMLGLALAGLVASAAAAQGKREKLRVVWGGDGMHFMLLHVAAKGGFFDKQGLDLDVINVPSGSLQMSAILGGTADIAPVGFTNVIQARAKGADVVAVANAFNVVAMSVVLSNDAIKKVGITDNMSLDDRVKRLNGLRIGITAPGSGSDTMLRTLLRARGMDPDSALRIQPLGDGPTLLAALEKGATDGFVWMAPTPELAVKRGVGKVVVNPFAGEVPEIAGVPYIVMASSVDTLKSRPETVKKAIAALRDAAELIRQNPTKASEYLKQAFPDIDPALLKDVTASYANGIPRSLVITSEQAAKSIAWMNISAKTPISLAYKDIVSPTLAEAVESGK
jgi:NitT/TauT family transport system substrate-binding protein